MTSASAGMRPLAVTLVILSSSTTTTTLLSILRPSHSFPNLMAFVAAIALVDAVSEKTTMMARKRGIDPLLLDRTVARDCADADGRVNETVTAPIRVVSAIRGVFKNFQKTREYILEEDFQSQLT